MTNDIEYLFMCLIIFVYFTYTGLTQGFCPFLMGCFVFFIQISKHALYILDTNTLSDKHYNDLLLGSVNFTVSVVSLSFYLFLTFFYF